ncbi:Rieske (2Fe-2S) protein [Azotobacter beijerinckii]|uniref:Ferredoxin subunit of nitrite reductase or a ring-hydroxylating dioxygenase n=1 Tax=Azotobacter beijerinckii TaxID=170623 RepID=A0A1I4BG63_9GAMM|nr:Rieske (2Fe-2S) protein [Azotobacter beijerinckii]SFB13260.1 Ferredoxin subunit of nitrite reductase or a ring-hydroxylating dioxygenase [Azotobacter beijerinckii]SFK66981.1 Ferredoxin subunit of nitrite reductase or a ring-hydroxylating dioxygenase [Azotobacter beijerinckii]
MQFLCSGNDLGEGQGRGFRLEGRKLLAVRRDGRVFVYLNRCPHRGIPLERQADQFLDPSGSLIQCATHGALFLIDDGECVAGPCAGQHLPRIDCREDAAGIWVRL